MAEAQKRSGRRGRIGWHSEQQQLIFERRKNVDKAVGKGEAEGKEARKNHDRISHTYKMEFL